MRLVGLGRKLVAQRKRRILAAIFGAAVTTWIGLIAYGMELRDLVATLSTSRGAFSDCLLARHQERHGLSAVSTDKGRAGAPDNNAITNIGFATVAFGSYGYWKQVLDLDQATSCSSQCHLVSDVSQAHALLFHSFDLPSRRRLRQMRRNWPADQLWIFYSLESPVHLVTNKCIRDCQFTVPVIASLLAYVKEFVFPSYLLRNYPPETTEESGYFNWTITYRRDSTFYTPYGRYARIVDKMGTSAGSNNSRPKSLSPSIQPASKKHLSFIVVSNCHPFNQRQAILAELSRHMELHIYGACGDRKFPAGTSMTELSKLYYFHLSFENAFCRDYITEKFFHNGLDGFAVPVAFGGFSRADYDAVAPPNSFIYASDFGSAASLAGRLKTLAANHTDYMAYHRWRMEFAPASSPQGNLFCQICNRVRQSLAAGGPQHASLDLNRFYSSGSECRPADFDPFRGDTKKLS